MTMERPIEPAAVVNPDRKAALGDALRRRILTMQIAPGAVLDEVALSEEFGLSRPPVRELMRQMAGEGYIELEANRPARVTSMSYHALRDFFLGCLAGGGVGWLTWAVLTRPFDSISDYFIANSVPQGGGTNVVNVILVDFRGFDTYGEITVIGIAALGVAAMLSGARSMKSSSTLSSMRSTSSTKRSLPRHSSQRSRFTDARQQTAVRVRPK